MLEPLPRCHHFRAKTIDHSTVTIRLDFADQLPRQVGEDKRRMHLAACLM